MQSDLRIAILRALQAASIEAPVSSMEVTLANLETLRRYLEDAQRGAA